MKPTIYKLIFENEKNNEEYEVYEQHRCQEQGCFWTDPKFVGTCPVTDIDNYVEEFDENLIEGEVGQIELHTGELSSIVSEDVPRPIGITTSTGDVKCTEESGWKEYDEEYGWISISAIDVNVDMLSMTYEDLIDELAMKEVSLAKLTEQYRAKEFDIMFQSDFDFKAAYGSTSERVRKQHARNMLCKMRGEITSLELSVAYLKNYIPFLKEIIWVKGRD